VGNGPLLAVDLLGLAEDPLADLGHPTGQYPKSDCGQYAEMPSGNDPNNCYAAIEGVECKAGEYAVYRYDVPGQLAPHG
jgi:hypothetical protein